MQRKVFSGMELNLSKKTYGAPPSGELRFRQRERTAVVGECTEHTFAQQVLHRNFEWRRDDGQRNTDSGCGWDLGSRSPHNTDFAVEEESASIEYTVRTPRQRGSACGLENESEVS